LPAARIGFSAADFALAKVRDALPTQATMVRHALCSSWLCSMAGIDPSAKLIEDYEHTLEMLDEALVAVRLLIRAHDTGRQMSARVLRRIQKQCTAASVVSRRLRKELRHVKSGLEG
jgi:hypothetical protein